MNPTLSFSGHNEYKWVLARQKVKIICPMLLIGYILDLNKIQKVLIYQYSH